MILEPGAMAVIRAQAVASRKVMLTRCELPVQRQPVVPTGVGETETPSTWPISGTVNSLHGSAALIVWGNVDNSPNATSATHRLADPSMMDLPRLCDSSKAQEILWVDTQNPIRDASYAGDIQIISKG
jgi:hypothetical protein